MHCQYIIELNHPGLPVWYLTESPSITNLISNWINSIANARGLEELHFIRETRKNCRYEKMAKIFISKNVWYFNMFSIYSWTFAWKHFLQSSNKLHSCLFQEILKQEKALLKISVIEAWNSTLDSITLFLFMSQTRSHSGEWALRTTPVGLKEEHGAYHWLFVFLDALASLDFKYEKISLELFYMTLGSSSW